jgi:sugar transferase (PEP-CTERM/EpsH1 system associated)
MRRLIAHIVFRFDVGGLENGVVNLINRLPADEFGHAIIALTEATDFRTRLRRDDVAIHMLHKRPGKDPAAYLRLFRLLRQLRPDVVHTRNVGTLDCQIVARLAGVHTRIHGEHGWDTHDPDGTNRKYRTLRRAVSPLLHRFVTVSHDLERWLIERVGIPAGKVLRICNGVDTERFRPDSSRGLVAELPRDRFPPGSVIVGTVTRFEAIKDPLNLVRAFIEARQRGAGDLRLVMVGDGPLRREAFELLEQAGHAHAAWLPGNRNDVDAWLRTFHVFALSSRREGISNTVLEAMASGLPVVASATGGNLELVVPGTTGMLVPPENSSALADALLSYANDAALRAEHGRGARARAEQHYSIAGMVGAYRGLYAATGNVVGAAA